ncbi:motility associated factor glycosyltransferase family protein [Candidatus Pristimantibacillus sp. PTI5]|uniref:motility associated factor glycosyltransferase family protein n=1 Tax=Candidatus Pristimantibacillus sp. PTI5 TaxID=3400422 RepID=UPI003B02BF1D
MILADNVLFLKNRFAQVWSQLETLKEQTVDAAYEILPSKSAEPTVVIENQGKSLYLHSKYNPIEEARQFIQQFDNIEQYKHILFYGTGLGYHIEALINKYPGIPFTIYEPVPKLFEEFLSRISLPKLPAQCRHIILETSIAQGLNSLHQFVEGMHEELLFLQLPSYEKAFPDKFKYFSEVFKELISQKKSSLQVNISYEKRWIFNSLINLEETIKTPNVLIEKRDVFKGKPVILVAAGPSLQDEIEHLKYIKENGLAYIFSVGTSINALLAHGIHPDAACTYDPSELNQKVFEKLNELEITDIPLIFGSSVGFEVLKYYNGPKLHMLTSQDPVAQFYLEAITKQPLEVVNDASTISVIALQLLYALQSNLVILVAQNLAFRNNMLYSSEALVIREQADVLPSDRKDMVLVESVDGERIESKKSYLSMKQQIETVLQARPTMQVINTTQGGAKIEHTSFMSLEEVIRTKLNGRVVDPKWFVHNDNIYNLAYAKKQAIEMKKHYEELRNSYNQSTNFFNEMNRFKEHKDKPRLGQLFPKFDKLFMKIQVNQFYTTFLKPMNRVQEELLMKNIGKIKFEKDNMVKADLITQHFGKFIYGCQVDMRTITPVFEAIQDLLIRPHPTE